MHLQETSKARFALLLFLIVAIVVVSGCAQGNPAPGSKTLSIENFGPDIKGVSINPGEEVRFV